MVDKKIKPAPRRFTCVAATATGARVRNGHTAAADGSVKADLSVAREMGGPWQARHDDAGAPVCGGLCGLFRRRALDFIAKVPQEATPPRRRSPATCRSVPRRRAASGLPGQMHVEDKSLPQAELEALVKGKPTRRSAPFPRHAEQCGRAAGGGADLRPRCHRPPSPQPFTPLISGCGAATRLPNKAPNSKDRRCGR